MNATRVERQEAGLIEAPMLVLPDTSPYDLTALGNEPLDAWICRSVSMSILYNGPFCISYTEPDDYYCKFLANWFTSSERTPDAELYKYKYLPDMDGYAYAGRSRGYLQSNSLLLKSSLYGEWQDPRLNPWKHFVPMDHSLVNLYDTLAYLLGNCIETGHNEAAERIAFARKMN